MRKFLDTILLIVWIVQLIFAISYLINGTLVDPLLHVCETAICVIGYLEKSFK